MAAKFLDLISYFENLARRHVAIRHTDKEKHFFRLELDEVLGGMNRSDVSFPMLILEGYSFDYTDNKSDNLLKNRRGAFMLIDHLSDTSDYNRMHQIWEEMEQIGDDILAKIKADKRNPQTPAVRNFDFASVDANLLMTEFGNNVGIRFTYTLSAAQPTDVDESKWLTVSSE
ncbi:hypothetical protein [Sunxiuqinia sp. sy24]|uniref:hypothetical protein n=1 Tax=Sunxiuqinia sp. sy24 TaxID=3461495 RepID=UPI0040464EFB